MMYAAFASSTPQSTWSVAYLNVTHRYNLIVRRHRLTIVRLLIASVSLNSVGGGCGHECSSRAFQDVTGIQYIRTTTARYKHNHDMEQYRRLWCFLAEV